MWITLKAFIAKELRQTFRDKRMVALLVIAPLIQLIVLGFAVNLDVDNVPTIIADADNTPESRSLAAGFTAGDTFKLVGHAGTAKEAVRRITRGEVPVAFIIPKGYAKRVAQGKPAQVQVLVDGGDSNRAIMSVNAAGFYMQQLAVIKAQEQLAARFAAQGVAGSLPSIRVEPRILYNPTLNSQVYFVPGVAATLLLVVTMIVTAMGLAREKEMGTLEQVMVTPIRPFTLVLGKTIPYSIIGLADLGLVLVAGAWVFDMPLRGSLLIVFAAGLLYLLAVLGLGLFISSVVKSQQQALMGAFFLFMPFILLSGFMTPVENIPEWLRPLSIFTPVRHFVEILRGVLLKDAQWGELLPQFVALGGMGIAIFSSAAYRLSRRLA